MSEEVKSAVINRNAAILGIVLALLVGFYLGFTVHGLTGDKSGRQQTAATPAASPPAPNPALVERINALEKQTQLEPANAGAWTQLGNLYFDTHQPEKAIGAYGKALTLDPRQPDVLTDQGVMYRELGQFDKAMECFDKALGIDAGHVIAAFNKSVVLEHDKNDRPGAIDALKALAVKNPNAKLPDGHTVTEAITELSAKK